MEVVKTISQERISERTVEQNVPVQHVVKEILEVTKDVPQERFLEWTALRAPQRRNRQRNRGRKQSVSDSEDELEARLRRINIA